MENLMELNAIPATTESAPLEPSFKEPESNKPQLQSKPFSWKDYATAGQQSKSNSSQKPFSWKDYATSAGQQSKPNSNQKSFSWNDLATSAGQQQQQAKPNAVQKPFSWKDYGKSQPEASMPSKINEPGSIFENETTSMTSEEGPREIPKQTSVVLPLTAMPDDPLGLFKAPAPQGSVAVQGSAAPIIKGGAMNDDYYKLKYLKYKTKVLKLKSQF